MSFAVTVVNLHTLFLPNLNQGLKNWWTFVEALSLWLLSLYSMDFIHCFIFFRTDSHQPSLVKSHSLAKTMGPRPVFHIYFLLFLKCLYCKKHHKKSILLWNYLLVIAKILFTWRWKINRVEYIRSWIVIKRSFLFLLYLFLFMNV